MKVFSGTFTIFQRRDNRKRLGSSGEYESIFEGGDSILRFSGRGNCIVGSSGSCQREPTETKNISS